MARERLKDFLRSRGGGEMLNYVISDGGDQSYDPGVDDLGVDNMSGQELKPLIRDFLSEITQINDFPIAPGGEDVVLTTPEGDPAPLEPAESTGAARVFVESNSLQEYSDSGKFTQFVGPTGLVDKTRGQGGNELLPGVKGTGLDSTGATYVESSASDPLPTVVTSVLKRENRYTPDLGEQFVPTNTPATTLDQRPLVVPSELGKFIPTDRTVTFDDLRKIGTSLLLKAAQVDTADTPNDSLRVDDVSSLSVESFAGANFLNPNTPGATNKVDTRLFDATRADGSSQDLINKNKPLFSTPAGEGQSSYGTMNTPISPFNGPLPAAMMAQAAVGIGIVGGGTFILSTLFGVIPAVRQENPVRGPYLRGRSDVPSTAAALAELVGVTRSTFGLISTRNPYIDCVKAGTLSFFGAGGGGVTSVTGLASSILESPGYYVVIIRSILRSIIQIQDALKDFNSSGVSLQNLSAAVTLFDTVRRSRFVGYLNALAAIGDVLLVNSPSGISFEAGAFGINPPPGLDPTIPANRVMMSRESASPVASFNLTADFNATFVGASGRLSWRMGSAAASYLIPRTIFTGEIGTTPDELAIMQTGIRGKSMLNESGRLPKEAVSDIEALLDAEYVPFYFHDLRTNEVIGFHAFLDSLDDNFNVSATTEAAFGRLDGVKVYGGTTRSISFGFVIAATSEEDFDEMWFRINKLVTLVYPQWTPGDEVVGSQRDGGWSPKYKVPFSQVISSSPLIRVRIGDVIASNYSKFGLSRFFGATDKETVLSTNGIDERGANARKTRFDSDDVIGKKLDTRFAPPGSGGSRDLAQILESRTDSKVILKPSMGKNYTLISPTNSAAAGSVVPIRTYFPIRGSVSQADLISATAQQKALDTLKGAAPDAPPRLYLNVTITDDRYADDIKDGVVQVTLSDIMFDPDSDDKVKTQTGSDGAPSLASAQRDTLNAGESFFDPATNAVVRAFESTQGKGLAGMITSLKFTWLDQNNTWEVTRGSRAPMWCKVSIGMDVIHDLPLGMAHDGFMIAPAYPVGNVNRRFFGTPYTTPTQPYDVPIQPGNDDLKRVVNDPKVRNTSGIDPAATVQTLTVGG